MIGKKLKETKVFRDPIHTYISVEYQVIWDLLATFEMQRLRRIRQLGGTPFVFSSAEHSRFTHSLGVYEIVRRFINEVDDIKDSLTLEEQITILCAALLHDVGHGPFSHCFEYFYPLAHEEMSIRIISGDSEVYNVLLKYNPNLPDEVAKVIAKKHEKVLLNQLISSQIDADRMDYLLRDAYFSGTPYGYFDVDRLLRITRVKGERIIYKHSGLSVIENYMLGRYHMYGQVYYHPISLSYEIMIIMFLNRMKDLYFKEYKFKFCFDELIPFFKNNVISNRQYLMLDDYNVTEYFKKALSEEDSILKDLGWRLMHRQLFKYEIVDSIAKIEEMRADLLENSEELKYYFYSIPLIRSIYKSYGMTNVESINILNKDGTIEELSDASIIVKSLMNPNLETNSQYIIFYRKKVEENETIII